jgi:hypothetical protein
MTHLKTKMREISERVPADTIALGAHQLRPARVAFNARVSDLTRAPRSAMASR